MLPAFLSRLLGTSPPAGQVAQALGKKMGAAPVVQGDIHRITGAWNGLRCQVALDAKSDQMTVTVRSSPQNTQWELKWCKEETEGMSFVSTQVALTPVDAQRMERLPMKVRLHIIEVVEAGQGSLRLEQGVYTLNVPKAGLARPNAVAQASIRLDVMADLCAAAAKVW